MASVHRTAPLVAHPLPSFPGYFVLGHLVIRRRASGLEVHQRGDRALLGRLLRQLSHEVLGGAP
jgi:hypothetical protein